MKKLAYALALLPGIALGQPVSLSWDAVTEREDGSATTGAIDYVVTVNNELVTTTANLDAVIDASMGDDICVQSRETGPGSSIKSEPACVQVIARPLPPRLTVRFE